MGGCLSIGIWLSVAYSLTMQKTIFGCMVYILCHEVYLSWRILQNVSERLRINLRSRFNGRWAAQLTDAAACMVHTLNGGLSGTTYQNRTTIGLWLCYFMFNHIWWMFNHYYLKWSKWWLFDVEHLQIVINQFEATQSFMGFKHPVTWERFPWPQTC